MGIKLAVVGATGMVGRAFLDVLEGKDLPIDEFYAFASKRSAGTAVILKGREFPVEELTEASFDRGIDIALFSAGASASEVFAPIAAKKGCIVIDNSSRWRMDDSVPLVVPEVNPGDIARHSGIIANPNCSTIQAVVALAPLAVRYGLKRVVYSTYQAVSGAGRQGWLDLEEGERGKPPKKFPRPIARNCLPHIDVFADGDYTKEELKMVNETRKILVLPNLPVTATCARVPVFIGHSESVNAELRTSFDLDELKALLARSEGVVMMDDPANGIYPTALDAAGADPVYVGRVRRDYSVESGVNMWIVADNIRKGAALNAVQIAERIIGGKGGRGCE
ncbi:MAG: aspartate-semialdehyde dehydrogenase [Clostridiales bacterium]|nr:aspartate-semialdehyde dehydrogenase [Clostridiales bacterium]